MIGGGGGVHQRTSLTIDKRRYNAHDTPDHLRQYDRPSSSQIVRDADGGNVGRYFDERDQCEREERVARQIRRVHRDAEEAHLNAETGVQTEIYGSVEIGRSRSGNIRG